MITREYFSHCFNAMAEKINYFLLAADRLMEKPASKEHIKRRLVEITKGICPNCGSNILYSRSENLIYCQNQYDPKNILKLNGRGSCSGITTSVELLDSYCEKYKLDPIWRDYNI
jgi:hypothetical protein